MPKLLQKIIIKHGKYKKQDGMIISIELQQKSKKNTLLSKRQICFPNWQLSTTNMPMPTLLEKQITILEKKNKTKWEIKQRWQLWVTTASTQKIEHTTNKK